MGSKSPAYLLMLGGALFAIGSFLAWTSDAGAVSGVADGDGWYTLLAGVALLALGSMSYSGKVYPSWLAWVALAVGAAVALIRFFDIMGINRTQVGIGMWLMMAGVMAGVFGLVTGRRSA